MGQSWYKELIILCKAEDAEQALSDPRRSLQGQVMYVWNKATTDDDLKGFLEHRAQTEFKRDPLIIVGGAHGYEEAVNVTAGVAVAAAAGIHRIDWGKSFKKGEFAEDKICEQMKKYLNIHYVNVGRSGFEKNFAQLFGQFPKADLMICVCYGLATDLAKEMRDQGLSSTLAKKSPNEYVRVRVDWDIRYTDEHIIKLNQLAPQLKKR